MPMPLHLTYYEHRPPPDLVPWVACFWRIRGASGGDGSPHLHRVLPDGCADLLFDLESTRRRGGTHAALVGPMSQASLYPMRGPVDLLGVRLRPGVVNVFTGIPADRVLDISAPLAELPAALRPSVAALSEEAEQNAVMRLVGACRQRASDLDSRDALIEHAVGQWSRAEQGMPAVSVLVRDIGLSERSFERRFVAQVGLTPVRFRRLARLRAVFRLHAGGMRDWAALAAATGFSDQSHLVRDFRAFTGLTPTEWAASQHAPVGFLQDGTLTAL
jgi:AraC-like DNA-binding protein